jgi:hypothetical protein
VPQRDVTGRLNSTARHRTFFRKTSCCVYGL